MKITDEMLDALQDVYDRYDVYDRCQVTYERKVRVRETLRAMIEEARQE